MKIGFHRGRRGRLAHGLRLGVDRPALALAPDGVLRITLQDRTRDSEGKLAAGVHSVIGRAISLAVVLGALLLLPRSAPAQPGDAALALGTYRCSSYNVSGGGGSCRTMPALVLRPDGTYTYSSTRGGWSIRGDRLVLSESSLWGPGTILGRDTVRFEYDYRDRHHVVTWICQGCAAAPASAGGAGAAVGVSLTLEFGRSVGGVSGFVIVPAAAARAYTHNAPLPEGAVQGLAWETSRTAVALATGRNNRIVSGRRYIVFLAWPRETVPVAVLDLPPGGGDYTATLPATLDGAAVLARLAEPAPGGVAATPRPIGVEITDVTPEIARAVGAPSLKGAGVRRVLAGGPASRAGVREGDIITAINGIPIAAAAEAAAVLGRRAPGEAALLQVFRGGQSLEIRVTD